MEMNIMYFSSKDEAYSKGTANTRIVMILYGNTLWLHPTTFDTISVPTKTMLLPNWGNSNSEPVKTQGSINLCNSIFPFSVL